MLVQLKILKSDLLNSCYILDCPIDKALDRAGYSSLRDFGEYIIDIDTDKIVLTDEDTIFRELEHKVYSMMFGNLEPETFTAELDLNI